jgi:hypothetical protein
MIESQEDKALLNDLKRVITGVPSIDIIYGKIRKGSKSVALNYLGKRDSYFELVENWKRQAPARSRRRARFFSFLNAVDKKEKTILVRIHLERKKENILWDIGLLVGSITKEAKYRKFPLQRPKPHWDEYQKYLDVWDLRVKKGMKFPAIAKKVLPKYFEGKKPEPEAAINLVKHYFRQAKAMINGRWKQI